MHRPRARTLFLAVGWITSLVMVMAVSYAAIPDSNGIIRGCYDEEGFVRIVDGNCEAFEESITWKAKGPDALQPGGRIAYSTSQGDTVAIYIGRNNNLTRVGGLDLLQGCEPEVSSSGAVTSWGVCRFTADASTYEPQVQWVSDALAGGEIHRQLLLAYSSEGGCKAPRNAEPSGCVRGSGAISEALFCPQASLVAFRTRHLDTREMNALTRTGGIDADPIPFEWDIEPGNCTKSNGAPTSLALEGRNTLGRDVATSYSVDFLGIPSDVADELTVVELSIRWPRDEEVPAQDITFDSTLRIFEEKSSAISNWSKRDLVIDIEAFTTGAQGRRIDIMHINLTLDGTVATLLDPLPGIDPGRGEFEQRRFMVFPAGAELTEQAPKQ